MGVSKDRDPEIIPEDVNGRHKTYLLRARSDLIYGWGGTTACKACGETSHNRTLHLLTQCTNSTCMTERFNIFRELEIRDKVGHDHLIGMDNGDCAKVLLGLIVYTEDDTELYCLVSSTASALASMWHLF